MVTAARYNFEAEGRRVDIADGDLDQFADGTAIPILT